MIAKLVDRSRGGDDKANTGSSTSYRLSNMQSTTGTSASRAYVELNYTSFMTQLKTCSYMQHEVIALYSWEHTPLNTRLDAADS